MYMPLGRQGRLLITPTIPAIAYRQVSRKDKTKSWCSCFSCLLCVLGLYECDVYVPRLTATDTGWKGTEFTGATDVRIEPITVSLNLELS